jgi:hypothetical protein
MNTTLYPSLTRFFKNQTELAHAGCMSRTRLWECLTGQKDFTRAEKKAIAGNIVAKLLNSRQYDYSDMENALDAWCGKFDEIYRRKDTV